MNWTASPAPLAIRVVIITAFPPELRRWISSVPLSERVSGLPDTSPVECRWVCSNTTGMGPMRATAGLMSLGHDERFDLSRSYFLVAGIAGVDPHFGSIGSAFIAVPCWARWNYLLMASAMCPTGAQASSDRHCHRSTTRVRRTAPHAQSSDGRVGSLVWCHRTTARLCGIKGGTTSIHGRRRSPCTAATKRAVWRFSLGAHLGAGRAWTAELVRDALLGGGRGTFAVTQMEDLGVATASPSRAPAGECIAPSGDEVGERLSYPPARRPISEWFFHDPLHMRTQEAFDALITAGMPIVRGMLAAFADCDESTAVKKASGCTVAGPWSPPSLGIKTLIGTRYDSSEDGLVIALPWWAVWFIVALAAGVVPLLMSAVACLVWRRRRRAWLTRGSPAMAGTSSLPPAHLRHVQLHEVGEQCGSQHACPSGMSR